MFRSKLFWRLYSGYAAIIVFSTLIVGILLSRQLSENATQDIENSLSVRSELLTEIGKEVLLQIPSEVIELDLQATLQELGTRTQSRLTIIRPDGRVIADSEESPVAMDNHLQRPEIIDARDTGSGITSRFSQTQQQMMIYKALPVRDGARLLGFVRVSLATAEVDIQLTQLRRIILISASIVAIIALLIGLYFANRFTEPLSKMTQVAEAISQGDYERRINVSETDEIGSLAAAINRMARSSATRMDEITLERNRLSSIFAGMVEGVIDVDQSQKIVHVNQVAADLLGLSVQGCIGQPIWEVVRVAEIIDALEQALNNREIVKAQMRHLSEEDDLVVDIYAASLQNEHGDAIGAVVVLHNISELDHLERIRRDFVANASHELKTPITAIRGLTETIMDDKEIPETTRDDFIQKAHAQSLRLSTLVTDLMTISRLESDQQQTSSSVFDIVELVRLSLLQSEPARNEKQLELNSALSEKPLLLLGDRQSISQLADNLIDNAIKYTDVAGSISVGLEQLEQLAILTVKDSGIGISPQYQQRIFERFYRVDKARSRELGGTGLGLSIVKNIADRHGGNVSVESQPGIGSTFKVVLPLHSRSPESAK